MRRVKDCTDDGYWPDYPRITLAELDDLTEDELSRWRFQWRFAASLIVGLAVIVVVICGTPFLYRAGVIDGFTFTVAYVAAVVFAFVGGGHRQKTMSRTPPVSAKNGLLMAAYIIADVETPSHYELAYVDRWSGSYFRLVYAQMD